MSCYSLANTISNLHKYISTRLIWLFHGNEFHEDLQLLCGMVAGLSREWRLSTPRRGGKFGCLIEANFMEICTTPWKEGWLLRGEEVNLGTLWSRFPQSSAVNSNLAEFHRDLQLLQGVEVDCSEERKLIWLLQGGGFYGALQSTQI